MNGKSFGVFLSTARQAAGIAQQAELAIRLGVSQQTVSRWEQGVSRPRARQIPEIAAVVKVDVTELLVAAGHTPQSPPVVSFDQPWPVDALSPTSFERFCTTFAEMLYPNADVHPYGGQGHTQDGLDIDAVFRDDRRAFTFQCKRHSAFGPKKIEAAIKAHTRAADKKIILLSCLASPQAREAIKLYSELGWELWDREDISRRVRQLSQIDQITLVDTYFPGQRFALLGELEPSPWRKPKDFFARMLEAHRGFSHAWNLVGRKTELDKLVHFVTQEETSAPLLIGNGGSGKSRVLKAFADCLKETRPELKIFFLSRDTLTSKSFEDLGKYPKILVCDDAHEREDLGLLFDYAADSGNNARLVIALRRYGLAHVRQQARSLSLKEMPEIELSRMTMDDSKELAQQALDQFRGDQQHAKRLAEYTRDCPLATVVGAQILATGKSFPEFLISEEAFRNELMRRLTQDIVKGASVGVDEKAMRITLGAISLLQPIQEGDATLAEALAKVASIRKHEIAQIVKRLREAGILFQRGAKSRIAPDLLSDFIIEDQCINADGTSTGFAEEIFDAVPDPYAEHILLNLGRIDWRKSNGDTRQSRLLDDLWARLRWHDEYYTPHLRAAEAVAYYQPKQALNFACRMIREGHRGEEVAQIIRNVAYNYDYLVEACELLWELGRGDSRPRNQHPSHGVRILAELAKPEPGKPPVYIERIVDFALSLIPLDESWNALYTPLDILVGALATEGHTTRFTSRAMTMTSFLVHQTAMALLRRKVINAFIDLLTHAEASRAYRAASALNDALRHPMGALNNAVSDETHDQWTAEFYKTLQSLNELLDRQSLPPTVLTELADSVSWHANYFNGSTTPLARQVLKRLDGDIRTRTIRVLLDGWGHKTRGIEDDGTIPGHEEGLKQLAFDLISMYPNAAELRSFVEKCLSEIASANEAAIDSSHILVNRLLDNSAALAEELVIDAQRHPKSRTARFAGPALGRMLDAMHEKAQLIILSILNTGDQTAMIMVADAYGRYSPSAGYTEIDLRALRLIMKSDQRQVLAYGASAARQVARIDVQLAAELLTAVNLAVSPHIAHECLMYLCHDSFVPFSRLSNEQVQAVLNRLQPLDDLDDHWVQVFLRKALKHHTNATLEFLKTRITHAADRKDWGYYPVSSGPRQNESLGLMKLPDARILLGQLFDWALIQKDNDLFLHTFGSLIQALCKPFNDLFVSFLEAWTEYGTREHLDIVLTVLQEASSNFVFDHQAFVLRFLRRAQSFGTEVLRDAISAFYVSGVSGVRSGTPGEPFPQDIALRDTAQKVLSTLGRFDPAYRLYEDLLKYAENEIQRQRREGLELDEADE